uniref:Uncharacterized protein n=1 Tax=Macrostomum lignano TaxID=282301 RepID=A0A1I8FC68_9PLAT
MSNNWDSDPILTAKIQNLPFTMGINIPLSYIFSVADPSVVCGPWHGHRPDAFNRSVHHLRLRRDAGAQKARVHATERAPTWGLPGQVRGQEQGAAADTRHPRRFHGHDEKDDRWEIPAVSRRRLPPELRVGRQRPRQPTLFGVRANLRQHA